MRTLLTLDGRMGRVAYAKMTLLAMVLLTLGLVFLTLAMTMSMAAGAGEAVPLGFLPLGGIALMFVGLWTVVAASIRRLRDIGWSAWWLLPCAVPVLPVALGATIVLSLLLSFVPGRAVEMDAEAV